MLKDINYLLPRVLLGFEIKENEVVLHLGRRLCEGKGIEIRNDRFQKIEVPFSLFVDEFRNPKMSFISEGISLSHFIKHILSLSLNDDVLIAIGGKKGKVFGIFLKDCSQHFVFYGYEKEIVVEIVSKEDFYHEI